MGGGHFDSTTYKSAKITRQSSGISDFHYNETATRVHADLDVKRIRTKMFKVLESRDSQDHPESNAIIINLDVTGSNKARAMEVQASLPGLMDALTKYIPHPQISVAANDDVKVEGPNAFQMSEFESSNVIDDHIRNLWLVGNGGGNGGESYDMVLYAAARKTAIDCFEKRGRKGYLFIYADEKFFGYVSPEEINTVFGDTIDNDIFLQDLIVEAQEKYHVFVLAAGNIAGSYEQYVSLFGKNNVIRLEYPDQMTSAIAATIAFNEKTATPDTVIADLTALGSTKQQAEQMIGDLFGNRIF